MSLLVTNKETDKYIKQTFQWKYIKERFQWKVIKEKILRKSIKGGHKKSYNKEMYVPCILVIAAKNFSCHNC